MTEEKLGFARLDHWAEYFGLQRMEVLRAAINGRIGLYFHLDDCFTANLSNPNPGHQLARERLRPAYLQADAATLRSIAAHGEALNVQEAYTANVGQAYTGWQEAEKVLVWRSSNERIAPPINLRLDDLFAIGEHVKVLVARQSAPAETLEQRQAAPISQGVSAKVGTRRDLLAPLVERAACECDNDLAQAFALMQQWAREKLPRSPLVGVTEGGIKWMDSGDKVQELSRDNLRKRIGRMAGTSR